MAGPSADTSFFGHPRGLGLLFGVEMWERFSYYGMKALLGPEDPRRDRGFTIFFGAAWIIAADVFRTIAELCLSPAGLSYVSKTAPAAVASLLMGGWFLSEGVGNKVAGMLAAHAESVPAGRFFSEFVLIAIGAGVVLAAVLPTLRQLAGAEPVLVANPAA